LRQAALVFACSIGVGIALLAVPSEEGLARTERLSGRAALEHAKRAGIDIGSVIESVRRARRKPSGDPVVSREFPTSDPIVGAALEEQTEPAVGFDGTNYLVVWRDRYWRSIGIYGTRVSPQGVVLDPDGITIRAGGGMSPAVSFGAKSFLVVWEDCFRGDCGDAGVVGARVSTTGVVLDPDGFPIATGSPAQASPALAFDGTNWLVAWERASYPSGDIFASRVSQTGVVLDPGGIPITTAPADQGRPEVAFDGTNYLVVWSSWETPLSGARVSPAGQVLDPDGIQISNGGSDDEPRLAFDGANYLVVWSREGRVYGARVSSGGQVLDPDGIPISSVPVGSFGFPAVAFDGVNYLVVWTNQVDVYGTRVTRSGAVLDPDGIRISSAAWSDQEAPAVAFDGTNYLVVWPRITGYVGDFGPRKDIVGGRVSPNGVVLDANSTIVSTAVNEQEVPTIAFDGTNYLVAWRDTRPGWGELYAARVSRTGELLDPAGIRVTMSREAFIDVPALAFDGTNYLLVWSQWTNAYNAQIRGARVSRGGSLLDPDGFEIAADRSVWNPVLDFDGNNYLVVWAEHAWDCCRVTASRVSQSGQVLDRILIAASPLNYRLSPRVAFGGERYLVTWPTPGGAVYGTQVDTAGRILDAGGFLISPTGRADEPAPATFDGTNYVVAWHDVRGGSGIYAARIAQDGAVLDPSGIPVSTSVAAQQRPAIAFDGTNSLVVWADATAPGAHDLFGARLSPAGKVLDPRGIPVSSAPGSELNSALVRGPRGETVVAYQRRGRVLVRFVREAAAPRPCSCLRVRH
jgi:hypothetical protein